MSWFRNLIGAPGHVAKEIEKEAANIFGDVGKAVGRAESAIVREIEKLGGNLGVHVHSNGHIDENGGHAEITIYAGKSAGPTTSGAQIVTEDPDPPEPAPASKPDLTPA